MKTPHRMGAAAVFATGLAAAFGVSGCYVYADPAPAPVMESGPVYQPVYYDGNVVYYDEGGSPYVVVNDDVQYIPTTYVGYSFYVDHYHRYGNGYRYWARSHRPARTVVRHRRW